MKSFIALMTTFFIFGSCSNNKKEKENVDGGPCTYEDKVYPARLIRLGASPDSSNYNGWFEIESPAGNGAKDTISYLRMTNREISKEELQKNNIAAGDVYKYVVSTIKTGACNPDIRTIRLEKY